jgi:hypothetical protein
MRPVESAEHFAECVRDVGVTRVGGNLTAGLTQKLQQELERPLPERWTGWTSMLGRVIGAEERRKAMLRRRIAAASALSRMERGNFGMGSQYWSLPHGEPAWVTIPAGEFWMGSGPDDPLASDAERRRIACSSLSSRSPTRWSPMPSTFTTSRPQAQRRLVTGQMGSRRKTNCTIRW